MSARVAPAASMTIALDGRRLDEQAMIADADVAGALRRAVDELTRFASVSTAT